jgi:hypothetical protein
LTYHFTTKNPEWDKIQTKNIVNKIQIGKKVGEIFETKDYSIFRFRDDNRVINSNHVKKLSQRMKDSGWLPSSVVTINGSGDVIDGQHRVKAAMSVNCPIRYKVTRGAGTDEMTSMNTLQRNWSPFDHVHKWVVRGNQNYISFDRFTRDYPMFKYTEIAMFLNNSLHSVNRDSFEGGQWVVKNDKKGREWANYILELKPFYEKYYNKAIFVRAMIKILANKPEFIFEEFIHKVKLRPNMLVPCGTIEQYIVMIETIYNYHRGNKINLRF